MPDNNIIHGLVAKGLGEGSKFLSMEHYKYEIKKQLGFIPYPGTLNIKIDPFQYDKLKEKNKVRIEGFIQEGKKFGGASCYLARIGGILGAVIIPDITKHGNDMIEFISDIKLREKLNLKDNDKVKIQLS